MNLIRLFIIPLFVGVIGGVIGVVLAFEFLPDEVVLPASIVPTFKRGDLRTVPASFEINQARQTLVLMLHPRSTANLAAPSEAEDIGFVVTADGLVAAHTSLRSTKGVVAAPMQTRRPFTAEFARKADGKAFFNAESGLTFFKIEPSSGEESKLKPITLYSLEKIKLGQQVFSIDQAGRVSLHHVLGIGQPSLEIAVSSEDQPALIRIDGQLATGDLVFEPGGQLVGVGKNGSHVFPSEFIGNAVSQYLEKEDYKKTSLGIHFFDLSQALLLQEDLPSSGLLIQRIRYGSPALRAGLEVGDVLASFDNHQLNETIPFQLLLQRYAPGTEVEVEVLREGETHKFAVVLGEEK